MSGDPTQRAFSERLAPPGTLETFTPPQCDAWVVRHLASFEDFVAIYDQKVLAHPGYHVFSTFDDYDQASYTSGHAMAKYDLDPPVGDDDQILPKAIVSVPRLAHVPVGNSLFEWTYHAFLKMVKKQKPAPLKPRYQWQGYLSDVSVTFLNVNTDPASFLDDLLVLQVVPVNQPEDALCAFPNGYFQGDVTPAQHHATAAHLRIRFGYRLMALGASLVLYLRDLPLGRDMAEVLAGDIVDFHKTDGPACHVGAIADTLTGQRHLILIYGGG